jgi:predicted membrane protein
MATRVRDSSARTVVAIALIALGVLWTLDTLNIVESAPLLRWWPAVIVLFGLARLFGIGGRAQVGGGAVITLIGAWLLGSNLDLIHVGIWDLWPLVLVAIGVTMIVRSRAHPTSQTVGESSSEINKFAFWSGVRPPVHQSQEFRGGELTAIMGGIETNLRGSRIAESPAVIDLLVIWGGVDLKVPEDWRVVVEATVVMGGIDSKIKTPPPDSTQTLVLRGMVLMGGVEIKN